MNFASVECDLRIVCPVFVLIGLLSSALFAQDPFGGGDPFGSQNNRPAPVTSQGGAESDSLPVLINPTAKRLVEGAIERSNPTSAEDLTSAIEALMDVESYDLAKQYLSRLTALPAGDVQHFELHSRVGSPFFLRLATETRLQPEGKSYADQVLDGAFRYTYNPNRLDSLTRRLADSNLYIRSDALSQLRSTGSAGAAAIINAFRDSARASDFPYLRTALVRLGTGAEGPLLGAVLSSDENIQAEAAHALGFVQTKRALESLYRPLVMGQSNDIRGLAATSLERQLGRVPNNNEVEQSLYRAARDYLRAYRPEPYLTDITKVVWMDTADGLRAERVRVDIADQMLGARLAETLYMMRPDHAEYQTLYLVAVLQAAKSKAGLDQPVDVALSDSIARRFTSDQLGQALRRAIQGKNTAAAIAACELLAEYDASVLSSIGELPSPLVSALGYGDQRVTFAAIETISRYAKDISFAGRSNYVASLAYLARSTGTRKVLIGHRNPETARTLGEAVRTSGYMPVIVLSAKELYKVAISDPDIESVLISDSLSHPDYIELVQLLRRDWRTRRLPVGFMYENLKQKRIDFYVQRDPLCSSFPLTADPSLVARQMEQVRVRVGLDTLGPSRRSFHARWCIKQISDLAKNESPIQYDFAAYEQGIAEGLHDANLSSSCAEVLGQVGTRYAQTQLISVANQVHQPLQLRQTALSALAIAFKKNGIQLTRDEIQHQYDIYNASVSQPVETQQILSQILDLLENK